MGITEILVLLLLSSGSIVGIIFLARYFTKKVYPERTEKMLDALPSLTEIGLQRDQNGYSGKYRDFPVYIYATTSIKSYGPYGGNRFQVWIIAAPEKEQVKGLGGFFGKYIISGEKEGYAMIGFMLSFDATATPAADVRTRLDEMIGIMEEKKIKPYTY